MSRKKNRVAVTDVEARLAELGLTLPVSKPPVANYLNTKRSGDLLFVSGRVSQMRGEVGREITIQKAQQAARDTTLDLLASMKEDLGGSLGSVVAIERLHGFIRSAPDFTQHPVVLDGASDLLIALWGDAGRHARSATGVLQLPFGAAVQLELIARLAR